MKSIIFIAPPAAGKGTVSEILKEKYGLPHISTGDLLREAVLSDNPHKDEIKKIQEAGLLVNDEIVLDLLKTRISMEDCNNGYILDGFPRNIEQAKLYEELLKEFDEDLGIVVLLEVDKNLAMARITGRLNCPDCGAIYNDKFDNMKPTVEGICDKCSAHLNRRSDDNEKTFTQRFDTYLEKTEPLIHYYEEKGNLYRVESIDALKTVEEIEKIMK